MRHILLIPPGSFLKRDYDRFGIEILKKFFSVKIIDLTPWLYPDISKIYSKQIYQCDEYMFFEEDLVTKFSCNFYAASGKSYVLSLFEQRLLQKLG